MTNLPTTPNATKFLGQAPHFYGSLSGHDFYECPVNGEDSPIKCVTPAGKIVTTNCMDWDTDELACWIESRA